MCLNPIVQNLNLYHPNYQFKNKLTSIPLSALGICLSFSSIFLISLVILHGFTTLVDDKQFDLSSHTGYEETFGKFNMSENLFYPMITVKENSALTLADLTDISKYFRF